MTLSLQSQIRGDKRAHRFRLVAHVDGCHWYASVYVCVDCGASYGLTAERDLKGDPYSAIWMEPAYDDDGNEVRCDRCEELQNGAEPQAVEEFVPA